MNVLKMQSERELAAGNVTPQVNLDGSTNKIPLVAAASDGSVDNVSQRANYVSQVLEEILAYPPSPHWGINE